MPDYVEAARLDQIPRGASWVVKIGAKHVALFNVDGIVYAVDDSCAHAGSSLGAGKLVGKIVTCRSHGWRYDVTTGHLTTGPDLGVASYPVKIVDDKVLVAVSGWRGSQHVSTERWKTWWLACGENLRGRAGRPMTFRLIISSSPGRGRDVCGTLVP